mmetsp:Transcript_15291/g.38566  ORF Transcript_15291/g.38566 Transcript_15291/m.38566 type:complete len:113 (-) Transcript_15291:98-436(-)
MLGSASAYLQVGGVGFLLFGQSIFEAMGMAIPAWYLQLRENQLQTFLGLFVLSSVAQNMCATGAFEVQLNGETLFSKLQAGRMPSINEIERLLDRAGVPRGIGEHEFGDQKY